MREIKFRVWDTYRNKMIKWDELHSDSNYLCLMVFDGNGYRTRAMQYTGLKDKNGKEIYEGDIVLATLKFFNINNEKCKVIFHNGSFGIQYGFSPDYFKPFDAWDEVEVIGNIYDNPELLKEESV